MLKLHAFIEKDEESTVLQGWEFSDVIVSGDTLEKAKKKFVDAVKISLKADILQACESLGNSIQKNNVPGNIYFLRVLDTYTKCIIEYQHNDEMTDESNKIFLEMLKIYLANVPNNPQSSVLNSNLEKIEISVHA